MPVKTPGVGVSGETYVQRGVTTDRTEKSVRDVPPEVQTRSVDASDLEDLTFSPERLDDPTTLDFIASLNQPTLDAIFPELPRLLGGEWSGLADDLIPVLPKFRKKLRDWRQGVKVLSTSGPEQRMLTLTEIHRPRNEGCVTQLAISTARRKQYGFSVKVFGVGAGLGKQRGLVKKESFEAKGKCLNVQVPVTVRWEYCRARDGKTIRRAYVTDVSDIIHATELPGRRDRCKFAEAGTEGPYVPPDTTIKVTLGLEEGKLARVDLGGSRDLIEVRAFAEVTVTGTVQFDYLLSGPCRYQYYRPGNGLVYVWKWKEGIEHTRPRIRSGTFKL